MKLTDLELAKSCIKARFGLGTDRFGTSISFYCEDETAEVRLIEQDILKNMHIVGLSIRDYSNDKKLIDFINQYKPTKETMNFELSKNQEDKYKQWRKSLPPVDYGAIGGGYSFQFIPTGLGSIIKVVRDDGHEIDLTEDEW